MSISACNCSIKNILLYCPTLVGKPKGLAARLQKQQNQGLRTVLGIYKATLVHMLETKLYIPLLDLWLNRQIARFQAQLEYSGIA